MLYFEWLIVWIRIYRKFYWYLFLFLFFIRLTKPLNSWNDTHVLWEFLTRHTYTMKHIIIIIKMVEFWLFSMRSAVGQVYKLYIWRTTKIDVDTICDQARLVLFRAGYNTYIYLMSLLELITIHCVKLISTKLSKCIPNRFQRKKSWYRCFMYFLRYFNYLIGMYLVGSTNLFRFLLLFRDRRDASVSDTLQ